MNLLELSSQFPRDAVHWRPQGKPLSKEGRNPVCMALAYIDARDVMDRLDEVCGPDSWQTEFVETAKGRVICRIGILTGNGWVWKGDGAGDTDVEGEKGGISDALKRAAVSWGIGRYLYRLKSPWVECEVGNNGQWRKWTQDPWAKVQTPPSNRPALNQKPQMAQASPSSAAIEAKARLLAAESLDALAALWKALPAGLKTAAIVSGAKDSRKEQLTQGKAA